MPSMNIRSTVPPRPPGALEAQPGVCAHERAVSCKYVSHAAAHLASYHKSAVPLEYGAAFDDDVLARASAPPAVGVLAALYADAVVAHVERGVSHHRVAARLKVKPVAVLRIFRVLHRDVVYEHVLAHQRVDVPRRRIAERHALQPYVAARHEAHHHGAHVVAYVSPLVVGGNAECLFQARRLVSVRHSRVRKPVVAVVACYSAHRRQFLPLSRGCLHSLQRSPVLSVAIDDALAGYGDVLKVHSGHGRLAAPCIQSLEHRAHGRIETDVG